MVIDLCKKQPFQIWNLSRIKCKSSKFKPKKSLGSRKEKDPVTRLTQRYQEETDGAGG